MPLIVSTYLEDTYLLPLSDEVAVDDMEIRIGDRTSGDNHDSPDTPWLFLSPSLLLCFPWLDVISAQVVKLW